MKTAIAPPAHFVREGGRQPASIEFNTIEALRMSDRYYGKAGECRESVDPAEPAATPKRIQAKEPGLQLRHDLLQEAMKLIGEVRPEAPVLQIRARLVRAIDIAIERENRRVAALAIKSVGDELKAVARSGFIDPYQTTAKHDLPHMVEVHRLHFRVERVLDYLAAARAGLVPAFEPRTSRPVDTRWFSGLLSEERTAFQKARTELLGTQISRDQVRELAKLARENLPKRKRGGPNNTGRPFERELLEAIVDAWESAQGSGKKTAYVRRPGVKKPTREQEGALLESSKGLDTPAFTQFCQLVYKAVRRAPGPEDQGFYDMVRRARIQHDFFQTSPDEMKPR